MIPLPREKQCSWRIVSCNSSDFSFFVRTTSLRTEGIDPCTFRSRQTVDRDGDGYASVADILLAAHARAERRRDRPLSGVVLLVHPHGFVYGFIKWTSSSRAKTILLK